MKKILLYISLYCSIVMLLGCNNNNLEEEKSPAGPVKSEKMHSKDLNLAALEMLQKEENSTPTLNQAAVLLHKALQLDSANYAAYNNLVNVYLELGAVDSAYNIIKILNSKATHPDYELFQGFIEERQLNNITAANISYSKALKEYKAMIDDGAQEPNLYINYIIATYMLEGSASSLPLINKYDAMLHEHPIFQNIQELINRDDRATLLNQLY